jgi:predicted RNA-binding Zn-ribbon protein involved in translation (DUF1610 family)
MSDDLDKLFACLVRAVRDQRPEQLAQGLDVSQLLGYVPYKDVRTEIGAATNDDYGHAVTRLLSGERGLLFADDLMQDDLKAELAAKNPDLQAYRSYLNTRVTLSQERVRAVLDGLGPAPAREAAPPIKESPSGPRAGPGPATRERLAASLERAVPSAIAPAAAGVMARAARPGCKYCGQPLPTGRDVRFCPHCGQDLALLRCGACSAELEPGWKFCVACGRAATP